VTFATATASAGSTCSLQLNTTSGFIELIIGSGTAATTSVNPTTSSWYRADLIYRLDLNPRTASLNITLDGASAYAGQATATGPSEAATTSRWLALGSLSSSTMTVEFADILGSFGASGSDGDFPIVPQGSHHRVTSVLLNADGTHSVGSATFRYTDNNGGAFTNITNGTTDSWTRVDEWPPTADGSGSDDWVEKSAGTTLADLVEWVLAIPSFSPNEQAIGIHTHSAIKASSASADNCALYQRYQSTDHATLINTGTVGSTTTVYRGMCYPLTPDGVSWDYPHLSAMKIRFSSDNITAVPQVKAVMSEVAFIYGEQIRAEFPWLVAAQRAANF
jgi:hypothetical protein